MTLLFAQDASSIDKEQKNPPQTKTAFIYIGHGYTTAAHNGVLQSDVNDVKAALNGLSNASIVGFLCCYSSAYNNALQQGQSLGNQTFKGEIEVSELVKAMTQLAQSLKQYVDKEGSEQCPVQAHIYLSELGNFDFLKGQAEQRDLMARMSSVRQDAEPNSGLLQYRMQLWARPKR